ncbi:hypothetical protein ACVLV4_000436 [Rathayibacter agropyri]
MELRQKLQSLAQLAEAFPPDFSMDDFTATVASNLTEDRLNLTLSLTHDLRFNYDYPWERYGAWDLEDLIGLDPKPFAALTFDQLMGAAPAIVREANKAGLLRVMDDNERSGGDPISYSHHHLHETAAVELDWYGHVISRGPGWVEVSEEFNPVLAHVAIEVFYYVPEYVTFRDIVEAWQWDQPAFRAAFDARVREEDERREVALKDWFSKTR